MGYFGTFRAHEGAGVGGGGTHRRPAPGLSPRARARAHPLQLIIYTAHTAQRAIDDYSWMWQMKMRW